MTYTKDSPISGYKADVSVAEALSYGTKVGSRGNFTDYVKEIWRLSKIHNLDPVVVLSQFFDETNLGTSTRWRNDGDPAGIGIFSDDTESTLPDGLNGTQSARIHACELLYKMTRRIPIDLEEVRDYDPHLDRVRSFVTHPGWPNIVKINDLRIPLSFSSSDFTWAENQKYGEQIAGHANRLVEFATHNEEQEVVSTFTTLLPGIPGGALLTDYPIHVRILPASQTVNRPGIKASSPRRCVQHGNGNSGAFAASDSLWLFNGARNDQGIPQQTSFHADADDIEVWFNIPGDEVTWQSADGGGPGNMSGFSCEMSEHSVYRTNPARLARNIYINADFMGRIAARLKIAKPEMHWDFNYRQAGCSSPCDATGGNRHDCANILRHMTLGGRSCWSVYSEQWTKSKADEVKRMNGDVVIPPVEPPKPVKPAWFDHGLKTRTNQHGPDGLFAQYIEMPLKVAAGRKGVRRTFADKKGVPVETLPEGTKVISAFMARINGLDWMWDDKGWAYQLNAFTPRVVIPFPPRD